MPFLVSCFSFLLVTFTCFHLQKQQTFNGGSTGRLFGGIQRGISDQRGPYWGADPGERLVWSTSILKKSQQPYKRCRWGVCSTLHKVFSFLSLIILINEVGLQVIAVRLYLLSGEISKLYCFRNAYMQTVHFWWKNRITSCFNTSL